MKYLNFIIIVFLLNIQCEEQLKPGNSDKIFTPEQKLSTVNKIKADSLYAKILYNNDNYIT